MYPNGHTYSLLVTRYCKYKAMRALQTRRALGDTGVMARRLSVLNASTVHLPVLYLLTFYHSALLYATVQWFWFGYI